MTSGQQLILTALKYVGIKEDPTGYNTQIRKWIEASCNSIGLEFPKDDSEFAWCACFISNMLIESGLWSGNHLHIVSARSFLKYGETILEPEMGDIVTLERGLGKGHNGIYINELSVGRIRLLSGNSSDSVNISEFDKSRVLGYRRI